MIQIALIICLIIGVVVAAQTGLQAVSWLLGLAADLSPILIGLLIFWVWFT